MGWFSKRQEVLVENKIKNDLSLELRSVLTIKKFEERTLFRQIII